MEKINICHEIAKQYGEINYTWCKFQYHRNNVERLCPKLLGLTMEKLAREDIEDSKKILPEKEEFEGPDSPLDYEYDCCIDAAKRLVDASCKLILLSKTRNSSSIQDFSLRKFFTGLSTLSYSPKLRWLCEICNKESTSEIKKAFGVVLADSDLSTWLCAEWTKWVKVLNNKRTWYQHFRSEGIETIKLTKKDFQSGETEINTFASKIKYLMELSENLGVYYSNILIWPSKH